MGYIGQAPANKAITSADIEDGVVSAADLGANSVDSSELVDGSIDTSHIGALQVTGAKLNTDVISAQTALGATPADTDELLVSDAGVLKRVDYSYLKGITAANFRPNAKPIIVNGNCAVSQRSTSVTGITGSGYNTIDRFKVGFAMGTWTQTQESLTSGNAYTDGFSNALKMDCTTADTSVGSSDRLALSYNIEGQDLQLLKKGTANAEKITIAFWVKATKTGTNILELYDNDNNRHISIAYTVSSSNTWEHKVINIAADTSGALGDDNGSSITINWWMGAGSNFSSGTLATAWASVTDANRAVGQVNNADSTSNNFHITGVQLEVGEYTSSTLPPFQHESYGDNLARCQRYYYNANPTNEEFGTLAMAAFYSGTMVYACISFPVTMRAVPTADFVNGSSYWNLNVNAVNDLFDTLAVTNTGTLNAQDLYVTADISSTQGFAARLRASNTSARCRFDSEL